jgi:3-dehydroquinate synthase
MPAYSVITPQRTYEAIVERGVLGRLHEFVPSRAGKLFVVTTADVWQHHGAKLEAGLAGRPVEVLFFPGGESRKRLTEVEVLADQLVLRGGDRSSVVITFGGGIVGDLAGFVAAIFMRGIPVIQIPTTLLSQVDSGVGGKTAVNLVSGKNLIGSFHQPLAALIDPDVLATLPPREYSAGLFEVVKCGVIRSPELFRLMEHRVDDVLAQKPDVVDTMIAESVRIKADVVTADEREGDLRRILNFGHTIGHTLEAETGYKLFLHGEAVAFGMKAATHLACSLGLLPQAEGARIVAVTDSYGKLPSLAGIEAASLLARLKSDKKTIQGSVHFVLPVAIGDVKVVSDIDAATVLAAIEKTLSGASV